MARRSGRKSGGDRKHGRNRVKCENYRRRKLYERAHIRRIEKHLAKYGPGDKQALEALEKYKRDLRKY